MPARRRSVLLMDDKSINLWRQIEDCRRREREQAGRAKPSPAPLAAPGGS